MSPMIQTLGPFLYRILATLADMMMHLELSRIGLHTPKVWPTEKSQKAVEKLEERKWRRRNHWCILKPMISNSPFGGISISGSYEGHNGLQRVTENAKMFIARYGWNRMGKDFTNAFSPMRDYTSLVSGMTGWRLVLVTRESFSLEKLYLLLAKPTRKIPTTNFNRLTTEAPIQFISVSRAIFI